MIGVFYIRSFNVHFKVIPYLGNWIIFLRKMQIFSFCLCIVRLQRNNRCGVPYLAFTVPCAKLVGNDTTFTLVQPLLAGIIDKFR